MREREKGDKPTRDPPDSLSAISRRPGSPVSPEAGAGWSSGLVLLSWVAPGAPQRHLPSSPYPKAPAMRLQVSEGARPPKHRLAGSQGWCSGSCTSQRGGRKALLIPWEKDPWQTEKSECLPSALTLGPWTPYPRVFQAGFTPQCYAHGLRVLGLGFQLGLSGRRGRPGSSFSG